MEVHRAISRYKNTKKDSLKTHCVLMLISEIRSTAYVRCMPCFRFSIDRLDGKTRRDTADSKAPLSARGPQGKKRPERYGFPLLVFSPVFLGVRDKHGDVTVSRPITRPHAYGEWGGEDYFYGNDVSEQQRRMQRGSTVSHLTTLA